jgi:TonB family protein
MLPFRKRTLCAAALAAGLVNASSALAGPEDVSARPAVATPDAGATEPWVPPQLEHYVEAVYPPDCLARHVAGDVALEIEVDTEGNVRSATVSSAPDPLLGDAARDAALHFHFTPAHRGTDVAPATIHYTYRFQLVQAENAPTAVPTNADVASAPRADTKAAPAYETVSSAPAPTSAASAESIADRDLQQRIIRTPEDILRAVPGLVIAQHQGGGKADQYFMRGFDADHGTDIAFYLDGIPINLPSNGHGQGYSDMHFLLPETIDRLEITKGPYFAQYGDFDTAGAIEFHTRRDFPDSELQAGYGQFDTYRVAGVGSLGAGPNSGWLAGEAYGTNGPFDSPEGLLRYNVIGKQNLQLTDHTELTILALAYGSQWSASGLIPTRAVDEGLIDRFGSIDPTEGGSTQRQMLAATFKTNPTSDQQFDFTVYGVRYRLRLFNDFTFFLTDPVNGDEIEQDDERDYTGLRARYRKRLRWNEMSFTTTLGVSGRFDATGVALYHVDSAHDRLPTCYGMPLFCDNANVNQSNLSLYAEEDARLTGWLRIVLGARADLFEWNVTDLRPAPLPGALPTSGVVQQAMPSPKLAIVLAPLSNWDIYLDAGGGFHSNDARSVIATDGAGALARAWGGEVGSRVNLWNRLDVAAALWYLHLSSENTFDPDVDITLPNPPSVRYGVDVSARWDIYHNVVWADADISLAHATYTEELEGGRLVALAPHESATAGVTALLPFGFRARIGMRQIGPRPATTNGELVVPGYAIFDLTAAYRWRFVELSASLENIFNTPWEEAAFDYVSRLPGEPAAGVNDVDFTPGDPINVYVALTFFF